MPLCELDWWERPLCLPDLLFLVFLQVGQLLGLYVLGTTGPRIDHQLGDKGKMDFLHQKMGTDDDPQSWMWIRPALRLVRS